MKNIESRQITVVTFFLQDFEKSEEILTLGCAARAGEELLDPEDLEDDENLVYVSGSSSGGKASVKHYPFDYCWDKAQQSKANPVPIPGITRFMKQLPRFISL